MTAHPFAPIHAALDHGRLVPCLGPGTLHDVRDAMTGAALPTGHVELAHALNGGRPLSTKLTHEFSRAASTLNTSVGVAPSTVSSTRCTVTRAGAPRPAIGTLRDSICPTWSTSTATAT